MNIGDKVNYCSVIGGEITSRGHTIEHINYAPNNFGQDVAKISNKAGVVALKSLRICNLMKSDCIECTNENCAIIDKNGVRKCTICGAEFTFDDIAQSNFEESLEP